MSASRTAESIELPEVPLEKWLSAKGISAELRVNEDTILFWWHHGLPTGKDIPREYMRPRGFAGYLFHPGIVNFIRSEQAAHFDGSPGGRVVEKGRKVV